MVLAANALKIRNFFGQVTLILGLVAIFLAVSLGIVGLVMYFYYGDLFWLGEPAVGPGVALTLIIEGFVLELVLALSTVFFGAVVRGNLRPTLTILKKAKSKLLPGAKSEPEDDLEGSPREEHKSWRCLDILKRDFEVKAPKCLWISLLLLAGVNLGLSLTCYLLAGGSGPAGMGLAMRRYGTDPAARRAVDWLQQAGECCGDQVYTEWMSVQWCTEKPNLVPSEVGPPGYVNVCGAKHRSVTNDVPQSCCKPPRSPCIHDPLDLLGLGPLHNDGCSQFIEAQLDPKYIAIAKFHLFLCAHKLLLIGLVLLLRPKEATQSEKATDEEAKHLLDEEGANPSAGDGADHQTSKSWFSGFSKKKPPEVTEELKEGRDEQASLKPDVKKLWQSAVKLTKPLKKMSQVITRTEHKSDTTGPPESPPTEKDAVEAELTPGPLSDNGSATALKAGEGMGTARASLLNTDPSRSARSGSREMRERGLELKSSTVSRARSVDVGPVSPRPIVRGSFSEWGRKSVESADGSASRAGHFAAAEITPSKHEEHRLSLGFVQ